MILKAADTRSLADKQEVHEVRGKKEEGRRTHVLKREIETRT